MSTEAENSLVMELAGGTENTWLGGHDTATEGTYAWRWAVSVASVVSRTVVLFQRRDCLELHQVEEQRAQQRRRQLGAGLRVHGDHGGVGRRGVLHREVRVLEQISSANVLCRQYVCKKGDLQQTATTAPTACSCGTGWTAK